MRFLVQNVTEASVTINDNLISSIKKGYLVLVGFSISDNISIIDKMCDKLINMRVFQDSNGKTNLSIKDIDGEILLVSQFTLYADFKSGRRPNFLNAIKFNDGKNLYEQTIKIIETKLNKNIKTGVYGEDMKVSLINDGPFTSILDSDELLK